MNYIISKSLQKDIDYIKSRTATAQKCVFEIAHKLQEIADSNDLLDAGYNDIVEFAADQFGYARSTTLNYVAASRKYLEKYKDDNGKQFLATTCARIDGDSHKLDTDYKIGQLIALGKTTADDFVTMDSEGTITPDMTAKQIKDAVKTFYGTVKPESKQDPEPDVQEEQTESKQDPKPEEQEEQTEFTRTVNLLDLVICLVGDRIGEDYDIDVDCALDDAFNNLTLGQYRLEFMYERGYNQSIDESVITGVQVWKNDGSTAPFMKYPENI